MRGVSPHHSLDDMRGQQRLQVAALHREADAEEAEEVSDARVCHRLALGEQIHLNTTRIPISNPDFATRLVSTFILGLSKNLLRCILIAVCKLLQT